MSRKQISISLSPLELLRLDNIREDTGLSKRTIIHIAIRNYIKGWEIENDNRYKNRVDPWEDELDEPAIYYEDIPF